MRIIGSATLKNLKELHAVGWSEEAKFKLVPTLIQYIQNTYHPTGVLADILIKAGEGNRISMKQLYVIQKNTQKPFLYKRRFGSHP